MSADGQQPPSRRYSDRDYLTVRDGYELFVTKEEHKVVSARLEKLDEKLDYIVRNLPPQWALPAVALVISVVLIVVQHYWR